MYYKIKELISEGFSKSQISRKLGIHRKTIYHYLSMSEHEFIDWSSQAHRKPQKLEPYRELILSWLNDHNDLSGYQIHDWLLEHVGELKVSRRTVSSYVRFLRQKYHIPKPRVDKRHYEQIDQLPYGKQAQVDFGEYKMINTHGSTQKVHFFGMVLSRSRYKFFCFQLSPFTTADTVKAHEAAFEYFGGIAQQLVYDQDKVLLVEENAGDLVLTRVFRSYVDQRGFSTYFCRKADPQTKGKVENIIKYAKSNFLKNRMFTSIGLLNAQVLGWLERTANAQVHGSTMKVPAEELKFELPYLAPFFALDPCKPCIKTYTLRKDNTLSYKGNFYSVPLGTYQGPGTKVWLSIQEQELTIYGKDREKIAIHKLCLEKGKLVSNTNHRRNSEHKIDKLIDHVTAAFTNQPKAKKYFDQLRLKKGRYIRDQLQMIGKYTQSYPCESVDKALDFCLTNQIFSAKDFGDVITQMVGNEPEKIPVSVDLLHKDIDRSLYNQFPQHSDIQVYESIINNL